VPGDAGVRALRALLTRLDDAGIEVDGLSVHTPDLDDVFFALTGRPATENESSADASAGSKSSADASSANETMQKESAR
jgi:ABC-2 type transport system ATP-binding protein